MHMFGSNLGAYTYQPAWRLKLINKAKLFKLGASAGETLPVCHKFLAVDILRNTWPKSGRARAGFQWPKPDKPAPSRRC